MSEEKTIKCPICGRPYKFYPFYVGDQSACPKCVAKAERLSNPKYGQAKTTDGSVIE